MGGADPYASAIAGSGYGEAYGGITGPIDLAVSYESDSSRLADVAKAGDEVTVASGDVYGLSVQSMSEDWEAVMSGSVPGGDSSAG